MSIQFLVDEMSRLIDTSANDFSMLPGLSEDDRKSLSYLPKIIFSVIHHNYINSGTPIPSGFPIFKYKSEKGYSELNKSIALDLFLFGGYLRSVRRKLESKIDDAHDNRALQYLQFRMFTDPFVFGVMDSMNTGDLKNIIISRYGYYDSIGVFDYYKEYMKSLNVPVVDNSEIMMFVSEFVDNVLNKTPYIGELHNQNYSKGVVRLPSKNEYNLEQIINTVVPLEVSIMLGKKLEELEIPDDIKPIFEGNPKKQPEKRTIKKSETTLQRLIRGDLINEIPEKYRDDFTKYIEVVGNNNFTFELFPCKGFIQLGDEKDFPLSSKQKGMIQVQTGMIVEIRIKCLSPIEQQHSIPRKPSAFCP